MAGPRVTQGGVAANLRTKFSRRDTPDRVAASVAPSQSKWWGGRRRAGLPGRREEQGPSPTARASLAQRTLHRALELLPFSQQKKEPVREDPGFQSSHFQGTNLKYLISSLEPRGTPLECTLHTSHQWPSANLVLLWLPGITSPVNYLLSDLISDPPGKSPVQAWGCD